MGFPPVEERPGPEGAEEDEPDRAAPASSTAAGATSRPHSQPHASTSSSHARRPSHRRNESIGGESGILSAATSRIDFGGGSEADHEDNNEIDEEIQSYMVAEADRCQEAKDRLMDAETDEDFDVGMRRVEFLCNE